MTLERNRSVRFRDIAVIPALTLRQPWAWAVVHGGKDVENRKTQTKIRGVFAVHAGKQCEPEEYRIAVHWMVSRGLVRSAAFPDLRPSIVSLLDRWERAPILPPLEELPRGVIVGQSDLFGVLAKECENAPAWKMDHLYGYQLRDTKACVHKAVDGMPGWFYVPRADVVPVRFVLDTGLDRALNEARAVVCGKCKRPVDRLEAVSDRGVLDGSVRVSIRAWCHGEFHERTVKDSELVDLHRSGVQIVTMFARAS